MNSKNSLIFIVEDDIPCGKLIFYYLKNNRFRQVELFTNIRNCLDNMDRKPRILITDYRLKSGNGLILMQEAKKIYPELYCIMLSGMDYEQIISNHNNAESYINKYIKKGCTGMDDLLITLNNWVHNQYVEYFY